MKDRLEIVIVPTGSALVVLPAAMVRQVLPYAPVIAEVDTLDYVRGTLIVQQFKLNVIDMGVFVAKKNDNTMTEGGKFVWFSSLGTADSLRGYVLQASAMPHFMICGETDITKTGAGDHPMIACYVDIVGLDNPLSLPVFVPDLINLEIELTG